jgi:uncharacterized protein
MAITLTPLEARVIGCLIEKEITTPEQYPLSLNALTNACNQKSNREPVLELKDRDVQAIVDDLAKRRLVMAESGYGSRVEKYRHRFCNSEFGTLKLDAQELAIICELLLRGPQMPGELRSRANRMAPFQDVTELERVLERLAARADGACVARLAREPGRRESRYMHLFSGAAPPQPSDAPPVLAATSTPDEHVTQVTQVTQVSQLAQEVAALRAEVQDLREIVETLIR